jgi:arginine repressor
MNTRPPDLENINDNLPIEQQLTIIRRWAEQMGYEVVAATLQRALDELDARKQAP